MCRDVSGRWKLVILVMGPQFPSDVRMKLFIQRPHLAPQSRQLLLEVRSLVLGAPVVSGIGVTCHHCVRKLLLYATEQGKISC